MKTKTILQILVIFAVALASFSCSLLSKRYDKKEKVEYKLNTIGKTKLTLNNITGHINISSSDSVTGLVINAEKVGWVKKKDLDKPLEDITIEIDTASSTINITSHMNRGKSWIHFERHSNEINYDIKLPPGLALTVENIDGDVTLGSVSNETNISVTNGEINFDYPTGKQELEVKNGSIRGSVDSVKNLKLDVMNGKVSLDIGKSYNGEIKADVVNGKIKYSKLEIEDVTTDKKSLRGYIGSRQNQISINVLNGNITLTGK